MALVNDPGLYKQRQDYFNALAWRQLPVNEPFTLFTRFTQPPPLSPRVLGSH